MEVQKQIKSLYNSGIWAIPGGMVDPGEKVTTTVKREFMEEALDSTGSAKDNINEIQKMVDDFFESGDEIYRGYVDDPRNTDNESHGCPKVAHRR